MLKEKGCGRISRQRVVPIQPDAFLHSLLSKNGVNRRVDCVRAITEFTTSVKHPVGQEVSPIEQVIAKSVSHAQFLKLFLDGDVLGGKVVNWIKLFGFERFSATIYDLLIEQVADVGITNLFLTREIRGRDYKRQQELHKTSWSHFLFNFDRQRFILLNEKAIERGVLPSWDEYFMVVEFLMWSNNLTATSVYRQMPFIEKLLKSYDFDKLSTSGQEHTAFSFAVKHFFGLSETVRSWYYKRHTANIVAKLDSLKTMVAFSGENSERGPLVISMHDAGRKLDDVVRELCNSHIEQYVVSAVCETIAHLCAINPDFIIHCHRLLQYMMVTPNSAFWREQELLEALYDGFCPKLVKNGADDVLLPCVWSAVYLLPEKFDSFQGVKVLKKCVRSGKYLDQQWVESMLVIERFTDSVNDHAGRTALAIQIKGLIEKVCIYPKSASDKGDLSGRSLTELCGMDRGLYVHGVGNGSRSTSSFTVYLLEPGNRAEYVRVVLNEEDRILSSTTGTSLENAFLRFRRERWLPVSIARTSGEYDKGCVTDFDPLQERGVVQAIEDRYLVLRDMIKEIDVLNFSRPNIMRMFSVFDKCVMADRFITLWREKIEDVVLNAPAKESAKFEEYMKFLRHIIVYFADLKTEEIGEMSPQLVATMDHLKKLVLSCYLSHFA